MEQFLRKLNLEIPITHLETEKLSTIMQLINSKEIGHSRHIASRRCPDSHKHHTMLFSRGVVHK